MLMHEAKFTYGQTQQVVRETQLIELHTAGHYEIQRLHVSLNTSGIDESRAPMFVVEWGGRESDPLPLVEIGKNCF